MKVVLLVCKAIKHWLKVVHKEFKPTKYASFLGGVVVQYDASVWTPYKGLYMELHQRCKTLKAHINMPIAYHKLMEFLTGQTIYWPQLQINMG